jgi:hypothetical protein
MSFSHHPLCLADVSIRSIAVHRLLAQLVLSVLLQHGSKLVRCPLATEPVPGLQILNQPMDHLLKVLVLGQIDLFHLCGLHLLLQHLCVVCGNRYAVGMLEVILDHLPCNIVEHRASFSLSNSVGQKNACQSKKQLKFETHLLNLPRTSSPWHPKRSPGRRTT